MRLPQDLHYPRVQRLRLDLVVLRAERLQLTDVLMCV